MKTIKASTEILTQIKGEAVLKHLELCGRVCYKSEDRITPDSSRKFIANIIKSGHETILEHYSVSVRFIVDRGVSHELVRHRIASFSQESTRYCNYGHKKECTFIEPCFWQDEAYHWDAWNKSLKTAEGCYMRMIENGATPQEARSVLPNSLKTEIIMTANLREWRHFFKLRALGLTGKPHPQMLEVTVPLLKEFKNLIPIVFDDLGVSL